ncbi:hypothetical protein [Thermococcus sp.]|uniref:DNA replication complex subunit Gins51 n=1 Tax=Thermococcus sp. TaxID=35749 RepID=UPI002634AD65|nr:hypothetical protein [Thermococcus sp.]
MDIVKLRELLEEEFSSGDLVSLDDDFYSEYDSLIKALKLNAENSHERGDDIEEHLYTAQLSIAERLMRDIIRVRLHKIVDLAVEGLPYSMTAEERRIFTVLRAFIEREELPTGLPEEKVESTKGERVEEPTKAGVREAYIVKIDLPKILDPELKEYGPFKAGDLAVLPRQIAEVLLERDAAERVRISP